MGMKLVKKTIISLNFIRHFVFVTDMEFVSIEVGTEF
jgi:hypothetical protein